MRSSVGENCGSDKPARAVADESTAGALELASIVELAVLEVRTTLFLPSDRVTFPTARRPSAIMASSEASSWTTPSAGVDRFADFPRPRATVTAGAVALPDELGGWTVVTSSAAKATFLTPTLAAATGVVVAMTELELEEEEEEEELVGFPMGAPSPALIESRRFQLDEGDGTTGILGAGRSRTPPPLQLATVSSPIRWMVGPPRFTRRKRAWFCMGILPCSAARTLCRVSRATAVVVRNVACIVLVVLAARVC